MRPLLIDIGEFYSNPVRTGIQRTVMELMRHWPNNVPAQYVRYDPRKNCLMSVSTRAIEFFISMFRSNILTPQEMAHEVALLDIGEHSYPVEIQKDDKIFIPELFYDLHRVHFYRHLKEIGNGEIFLLIYDFVPWLRPEVYGIGSHAHHLMHYLNFAMEVDNRSYISDAVRRDFAKRISRQPEEKSPVLLLGADGIGLEPQIFREECRNFVCIGSFEKKKRWDIVFNAFRSLPTDSLGGRLQFLGKIPNNVPLELKAILDYAGDDVEIVDGPSDEQIRTYLRGARASVFISPNEGFGLPALETLYSSIPTIVYSDLPAVSGLPESGQIRLPKIDTIALATAMLRLRRDDEAEALWAEASSIKLPTWKEFTAATVSWILKR